MTQLDKIPKQQLSFENLTKRDIKTLLNSLGELASSIIKFANRNELAPSQFRHLTVGTRPYYIRASLSINNGNAVLAVDNDELDYFVISPLFLCAFFALSFYMCPSHHTINLVHFFQGICVVINVGGEFEN